MIYNTVSNAISLLLINDYSITSFLAFASFLHWCSANRIFYPTWRDVTLSSIAWTYTEVNYLTSSKYMSCSLGLCPKVHSFHQVSTGENISKKSFSTCSEVCDVKLNGFEMTDTLVRKKFHQNEANFYTFKRVLQEKLTFSNYYFSFHMTQVYKTIKKWHTFL